MARVRIACLAVPLFPLAARLRSEPELVGEALAILAGNGNQARVVAATRLARRAGVAPGMTLPQARARVPKLVARAIDAECERAAQEALLEVAEGFSPRVESAEPGCLYLDLVGNERRFATAASSAGGATAREAIERAAGEALERAAWQSAGLPARVGIAGSKLAARLAAGETPSPVVVPPGGEAAFLAPLPVARLFQEVPDPNLAVTLERWGISTLGELARLPESEVLSRLGPAGQELHTRARGLDPRPLIPREPPLSLREGMDLEWPLVALEPFLFVAHSALERLCARLLARGLGCRRLATALRLEPEGWDERGIDLPAATTDSKVLLTLVRLDLEGRPPGAAVAGFAFTAFPDAPRAGQLSLLGPEALAPDRLGATLARLFALLGPERVGSPRPRNGHRPEDFELVPYQPPPPPRVHPEPRQGLGLLTVRVLRPPLALEVLTAVPGNTNNPGGAARGEVAEPEAPYGATAAEQAARLRLLSVRTLVQEEGDKRPRIEGRVRVAAGPWKLEDGWWTDQPSERDYWDVELAPGGNLVRLFRDRASGEWFADGIYD